MICQLLHCLQAFPADNISMRIVLELGYKGEFEHLHMNPVLFTRHLSWSSWSEQWPCPQDKQLQSSSQFMLSTAGKVKLPRSAESMLPGYTEAMCVPAICVMFHILYLCFMQVCSSSEQIPNVQCTAATLPVYQKGKVFGW